MTHETMSDMINIQDVSMNVSMTEKGRGTLFESHSFVHVMISGPGLT